MGESEFVRGRNTLSDRKISLLVVVGMLVVTAAAVGQVPGGSPGVYSLISTSSPPAPPAIPLTPNGQGYVRVETPVGINGLFDHHGTCCLSNCGEQLADGRQASLRSHRQCHVGWSIALG